MATEQEIKQYEIETQARQLQVIEKMASTLNNIDLQGVRNDVVQFKGDKSDFKDWIADIERYGKIRGLGDTELKRVAFHTSRGPANRFIKGNFEREDYTWDKLKGELSVRYAEVSNKQQAQLLLRKMKQKESEDLAVYADRLLELADMAFHRVADVANQEQLVHIFVQGLLHDYLKVKVLRRNPATLQVAVNLAIDKENFRKGIGIATGR